MRFTRIAISPCHVIKLKVYLTFFSFLRTSPHICSLKTGHNLENKVRTTFIIFYDVNMYSFMLRDWLWPCHIPTQLLACVIPKYPVLAQNSGATLLYIQLKYSASLIEASGPPIVKSYLISIKTRYRNYELCPLLKNWKGRRLPAALF
jgi:hypothetical protein